MEIIISWLVRRARPVRKCPTVSNNYERSFASIRGMNDIMSPALSAAARTLFRVDRRDVTRLLSKSNERPRETCRSGVGSLDKDREASLDLCRKRAALAHTHRNGVDV